MTEAKDDLTKIECVYVGLRELNSDKIAEGYVTLAWLTTRGAELEKYDFENHVSNFTIGGKRSRSPDIVGGIYEMEARLSDEGTISTCRPGSRNFLRMYDNMQAIGDWQVRDKAAKMSKKARAIATKAKSNLYLQRNLVALREMYQRTPGGDRIAFELMVLTYLRRA